MRILLIEDDPSTAESIDLMLRKADLNTYVTDSGEEGIELAKLYDYDLIILDLSLPDIDGYEVLRKLRVGKIETPTLILSGILWDQWPETRKVGEKTGFKVLEHRRKGKWVSAFLRRKGED